MGVLNNIFKGAKKYPVVTGIVIFICIVLIATIIFIGLAILIGAIYALILSRKGKIEEDVFEIEEDVFEISETLNRIKKLISSSNNLKTILKLLSKFSKKIKVIYSFRKYYSYVFKLSYADPKYTEFTEKYLDEYRGKKNKEKERYIGLSFLTSIQVFTSFKEILEKINNINGDTKKYKKIVYKLMTIQANLYTGKLFEIAREDLANQFIIFYEKIKMSDKVKKIVDLNNIKKD